MSTVRDVNGKLYIEFVDVDYNEPKRVYLYYPTEILSRYYPNIIDKEATALSSGTFRVYTGMGLDGVTIRLIRDGDTKPIPELTRTEPIKPPGRGGKGWKWVWQYGQWKKRYN